MPDAPRCRSCDELLDGAFRFCPWCAAPQRRKLVEFFSGHPLRDHGRALRVSRYIEADADERHVRFSVWDSSGEVRAAVSIDDAEAERLARFLGETSARPSRARTLAEALRGRR